MDNEMLCPYCGAKGYAIDENEYMDHTICNCPKCGNTFYVEQFSGKVIKAEDYGIHRVDEMKCPYCNSKNINLVCNTSDVWWTGVNESEGEYRYECEECKKNFRIYERTKAIERRITKEE